MYADLIDFVRKQSGSPSAAISRATLIEQGLGVTGEEAADLIKAFSQRFDVDISSFLAGRLDESIIDQ